MSSLSANRDHPATVTAAMTAEAETAVTAVDHAVTVTVVTTAGETAATTADRVVMLRSRRLLSLTVTKTTTTLRCSNQGVMNNREGVTKKFLATPSWSS